MNDLTESLDFLSWSTETINAVRGVLGDINVPLPAFLAQLLALGVSLGLAILFIGRARAAKQNLPHLISCILVGAAAVTAVSVVIAWVDNALVPRSEQIIGRVDSQGASNMRIELLDFRGESMAPRVDSDSTGAFVINYLPEFADPPSAVLIGAPGCREKRVPLRRAHLLGSEMSIPLVCGGNDG